MQFRIAEREAQRQASLGATLQERLCKSASVMRCAARSRERDPAGRKSSAWCPSSRWVDAGASSRAATDPTCLRGKNGLGIRTAASSMWQVPPFTSGEADEYFVRGIAEVPDTVVPTTMEATYGDHVRTRRPQRPIRASFAKVVAPLCGAIHATVSRGQRNSADPPHGRGERLNASQHLERDAIR